MHVLVIGGSGNISSEVVRALLLRGCEVTMVSRGQRPLRDDVRHVRVDRQDRPAFEAAMRATAPDVVIDMIAFTLEDTQSAVRAFRGRVGHFVQTSTVMTYGPPVAMLWADEGTALNARSEYGRNKVRIDQYLLELHAAEGFPATIVKPAYTYGPGIPLHRQVGDDGRWIDRLRKGKPMVSCGDGDKLFQFLPSRDAGAFYALVAGSQEAVGQVYNMVHPAATTWDEWHGYAMAALDRQVEIVHVPMATLLAVDPKRYGGLPQNFGHTQLFSGEKAYRAFPQWRPTATDRVAWVAANIEYMDRQGLVVDTDAEADRLEDRLIAELRGLPGRVQG